MKTDLKTRAEQLVQILRGRQSSSDSVEIQQFHFEQHKGGNDIERLQRAMPDFEYANVGDADVAENKSFDYTVISPKGIACRSRATILLHGLNERSWNKYLTWAEQLAIQTEAPVVMFPIAFHINRTPRSWYNPRQTVQWFAQRIKQFDDNSNSTFANVTISSRISENPLRFYISGKETCYNLWQLFEQIANGEHPLFDRNCTVNMFGYSIGAMVAQVMMMANPDHLLDNSRLFIFMGGSIFSKMQGAARDILDSRTMTLLRNYYINNFVGADQYNSGDDFEKAFTLLLLPDYLRNEREQAFSPVADRIHAVTMVHDRVMTTEGVCDAFGSFSHNVVEEWDFPFDYSHQIPFPVDTHTPVEAVTAAFERLFGSASNFLLQV